MSHHHGSRKFWTQPRLVKLMSLIEEGKTDEEIGKHFGTSATAVRVARKRNGLRSRTRLLLSASTVRQRLGIGCAKSIIRWVENGWLAGHHSRIRCGLRYRWVIREADLYAFLENPDHWHRWDPARITDLALREWAIELRAGVRFLSLSDAARIACVESATIHQWITKGWLPRIRNGNHAVRESDLRELLAKRSPWLGTPVERRAA